MVQANSVYGGSSAQSIAATYHQKYGNGYYDFANAPRKFEYPMDILDISTPRRPKPGFFKRMINYLFID